MPAVQPGVWVSAQPRQAATGRSHVMYRHATQPQGEDALLVATRSQASDNLGNGDNRN